MNSNSEIPQDFDRFLIWLKDQTETAWTDYPTKTFEEFELEQVGGCSWRAGTKWQAGLRPGQIEAAEQKWGLQFPSDYRQFLSVLNAPDRGMYCVGWSDDPPYGLQEEEVDGSSFFDWQTADEEISDALDWPLEGLLFDVKENSLWPDSWGEQPDIDDAVRQKVTALVSAAPKLIPITGHRYLLANITGAGNPVLSVWQSDIIYYGSTLREFLLLELSGLLGLDHRDVASSANDGITEKMTAEIPFWGDLILRN
jgi:hypothetical protein